jgi:hypothetical protein
MDEIKAHDRTMRCSRNVKKHESVGRIIGILRINGCFRRSRMKCDVNALQNTED